MYVYLKLLCSQHNSADSAQDYHAKFVYVKLAINHVVYLYIVPIIISYVSTF